MTQETSPELLLFDTLIQTSHRAAIGYFTDLCQQAWDEFNAPQPQSYEHGSATFTLASEIYNGIVFLAQQDAKFSFVLTELNVALVIWATRNGDCQIPTMDSKELVLNITQWSNAQYDQTCEAVSWELHTICARLDKAT